MPLLSLFLTFWIKRQTWISSIQLVRWDSIIGWDQWDQVFSGTHLKSRISSGSCSSPKHAPHKTRHLRECSKITSSLLIPSLFFISFFHYYLLSGVVCNIGMAVISWESSGYGMMGFAFRSFSWKDFGCGTDSRWVLDDQAVNPG